MFPGFRACFMAIQVCLIGEASLSAEWPTDGGAGGKEYRVTILADSGPGSLREALEADEPRTIRFEIGGEIWLEDTLFIRKPYVTVDAESAPDPGITLMGDRVRIRTHDVILRHLRIRVGERSTGSSPSNRDAVQVDADPEGLNPSYNILIENCSISWALDESMQCWNPNVHDVAFKNCLIAEALHKSIHPRGSRSLGLVIGPGSKRILVQGNVFVSNVWRNIALWNDTSSVIVNNVIYNPSLGAIQLYANPSEGPLLTSVVGNVLIPGPDTPDDLQLMTFDGQPSGARIYYSDNITIGREETTIAEADVNVVPRSPIQLPIDKPLDAQDLASSLLPQVGAHPENRDKADQRFIAEIFSRSGSIKDRPTDKRLWNTEDHRGL